MKIDINDPRITAFALGELEGDDAHEMARAMQQDPEIRSAVDEARDTSFALLETFSNGNVHRLTSDQRTTIRSAGGGPVIEDLASSRVTFWKKPLIAGIGIAAAVTVSLSIFNNQPSITGPGDVANIDPTKDNSNWDWSQIDTQNLTAPVISSNVPQTEPATAHSVAAAIRDDTASFRNEVANRIQSSQLQAAQQLPESKVNNWVNVSPDQQFLVPLSSGASSWPWLARYINEQQSLPPTQSVRIEEMINHFSYQTPSMLTGSDLVADMEICNSPWNPDSLLLAVHVSARPGVEFPSSSASLAINPNRVQQMRLLGYADIKTTAGNSSSPVKPQHISKTHGNYVIYELKPVINGSNTAPIATLSLDPQTNLPISQSKNWNSEASSDLRFASTIAATGMMLTQNTNAVGIDAQKIQSWVTHLKQQDSATLTSERQEGLNIINIAAKLLID